MRIEKQIYEAQDVQPVVLYGKKEGQDQALPAGIENLGSRSAIYTSVESVCVLLKNVFGILCNFPWVDKATNRARTTGIMEAGATIAVSTVTTVTTVATVTNIVTLDSMQGRLLVDGMQLTAWNQCCRSRIT